MAPKLAFEQSKELRRIFLEHFELWKKRRRSGMEELAQLCGVSSSYLSHVGRYGRVPSRSVLILLAFNFELPDPRVLFDAAGIKEPWPYEPASRIASGGAAEPGFLSLKLDMAGFTGAIRDIVRAELKPRSVRDLLGDRPLRVGFNTAQSVFFGANKDDRPTGAFPELFHLLSLSLQARANIEPVSFRDCFSLLASDHLDVYGPLYSTPPRMGMALYTKPFCRVAVQGLMRTRESRDLERLPEPKSLDELRRRPYQISVLKESSSHHFALAHLADAKCSLVVSETPDESLERIALGSIPRPAHVLLLDSYLVRKIAIANPGAYTVLFEERPLGYFENTIAVRPDWPELVSLLNDSLAYLQREGTVREVFDRNINAELQPGIETGGGR